jgi:hypothetical protein
MRSSSAFRRTVLSITSLVLVALVGYAAYWHYMAGVLRDQLVPWAQARDAEGIHVRWDDADVDGFPAFFRFRLTNVSYGALRPVPVAMSTPELSVWAMPWNLRHWEFSAPKGARLVEPTGTAGFDTTHLDGSFDSDADQGITLDVTALKLNGMGATQAVTIGDAVAHMEIPATPPRDHNGMALGLSLQINQTKLPSPLPGFGDTLSGFSFSAQLKGALPPGAFVPALTQWRSDGGTIELEYLRLRWGSLLIDANGTLALDRNLQPEGALSAVITGQDAAVDVAVMTGTLKADQAGIAKTFLGLLAKPNADGQKAITMPMTLQSQQLYLGPAKIADVPTIPWQ